jgi:phage shock protein C
MNCPNCNTMMDPNARFCPSCGRPMFAPAYAPAPTRFFRPREGRMIAGVCAGIAYHYGWDVTLVRLVLALLVLFGGGGLLFYVIAWIVMPNGEYMLPPVASGGPFAS